MSAPNTNPGTSLLNHLKRLDVYRSIPSDLTEQTVAGASVSLLSAALISILFLSEFLAYLRVETVHDMFVDQLPQQTAQRAVLDNLSLWGRQNQAAIDAAVRAAEEEASLMSIHFNVTLPAMPCAITSIELQDVMGGSDDLKSRVKKFRTDSHGQIKFNRHNGAPLSGDYGDAKEHMSEGCTLVGHIRAKRVAANLRISSHASPVLLQQLGIAQDSAVTAERGHAHGHAHGHGHGHGHGQVGFVRLNTSHVINELYFGDSKELTRIGRPVAFAPLNGATKYARGAAADRSYEYHLSAVPTVLHRLGRTPVHTFQLSAHSNEFSGRVPMPGLFLRYDVEPISVRFVEKRSSFAHFLVSCCAIIGGLVAVMGLVNMAVKGSMHKSVGVKPVANAK